jgi:hypothetical protein
MADEGMSDKERRKELRTQYKQNRPEAGVYRIVNGVNGKALLGSAANLGGVRGKMDFARTTGMLGTFFLRLQEDIRAYGLDAFSLEILEVLEVTPTMTDADIRRDLATLEALWREKFDPALLY